MRAKSALIVCECPRDLAVAEPRARLELQRWGRFDVLENRKEADLVFLFSANKYLGDYLTRDLSTPATVKLCGAIPDLGALGVWTTPPKDLIAELEGKIEDQTNKWTLNDILMCSVAPQLTELDRLTPDDAIRKSKLEGNTVAGPPDRLTFSSPNGPNFCKQVQCLTIALHGVLCTPSLDRENRVNPSTLFSVMCSPSESMTKCLSRHPRPVLSHSWAAPFRG